MSSINSLRTKTIRGVSWSLVDNLSNYGVSFVVGIILARLLSPSEYGTIGIVTIIITILNTIVDSGFSNALIRKLEVTNRDYSTIFFFNLFLSVILYFLLFISSQYISVFFGLPELLRLCRYLGIVLIINALSIIHRVILIKKIDFKSQTIISLISSIPSGFVGIYMAYNGFGVWSLVWQIIVRQILNTCFLWTSAKWCPNFVFSISSFREFFSFGYKLLISSLIDTIWKELYQIVIGKFYKPEILGQYTRANGYASLFSSNLTSVIQRVSYPVLSSIGNDKVRLKQAYKRIIKITMFVSFTCMLGLFAISKSLVFVLIGEKWMPCVPFLQIICFNMVLYPLHALNLNMLQVQGRSDLFLKLEIIKKIIGIFPILVGIFYNIYAMLFGSVITGLFAYYLNAYYSGPFLNYSIKEQVKDILPSLGVSVIMAIPVYIMSFIHINMFILLLLQILVGVVIVVFICEVLKNDEYIEIKSIVIPKLAKLFKRKEIYNI